MAFAAILLSTIALTAWLFTLGIVSYGVWRYVYKPWQVMRADISGLKEEMDSNHNWVKSELGLRNARVLSDEELARAEAVSRRMSVRGLRGLG